MAAPKPIEVTGWLPNLIGPLDLYESGVKVDIPRRQKVNLVGVHIEDEPDFDRTKITFTGEAELDLDDPVNGILAKQSDTVARTAAHASISADGYIETRSAAEDVAASGHWRTGYAVGSLLTHLDSFGTTKTAISTSGTRVTFGGTANGFVTVLSGQGGTLIENGTGGTTRINCAIFAVFPDNGVTQLFTIQPTVINCGLPRHGGATAWGASEGEVTIANTGTFSLTNVQYNHVSWRFSGAGTGTYTIPAPTADQSYLREVEETGGFDKVLTIGSGTTYTLAANTRTHVKVTNNGVFGPTASGGWPPPYKYITAADIDVDGVVDALVDGVPALTLIFDDFVAADVEINGFTKPADGKAGEHKIINSLNGEFTVRIANNGNETEDTSVLTISGTAWVLDNSVGSYGIDYDWSRERWVPQRGAS